MLERQIEKERDRVVWHALVHLGISGLPGLAAASAGAHSVVVSDGARFLFFIFFLFFSSCLEGTRLYAPEISPDLLWTFFRLSENFSVQQSSIWLLALANWHAVEFLTKLLVIPDAAEKRDPISLTRSAPLCLTTNVESDAKFGYWMHTYGLIRMHQFWNVAAAHNRPPVAWV